MNVVFSWVSFVGFVLACSQPSSCCSSPSSFISITCSSLIQPDALPAPPVHPAPPLVLALAMLRIDMTIKTNDFGFGFCDFAFMSMRRPLYARPPSSPPTVHSPLLALLPLSTFHLAFSTCHALWVRFTLVSSPFSPAGERLHNF